MVLKTANNASMRRPRIVRRTTVALICVAAALACTSLVTASWAEDIEREDTAPRTHYRPADGWLGDVHPMFHNGRLYLWYLKVPLEPVRKGLSGLHSALAVSDDLVRWTGQELSGDTIGQPWWIVSPAIHRDACYTFYNGPDGFDMAHSQDLRTWQPYAKNPIIPYNLTELKELRDPAFFHHEEKNESWLVFTAKKRTSPRPEDGALYYAKSRDLLHWSEPSVFFDPGDIHVPECPNLFRLGERYYLLAGLNNGKVVGGGVYWVADDPEGPWRAPAIQGLSSDQIKVPNTASDGARRILLGWIPSRSDSDDFGRSEWGGHLCFPRELYAGPGGALYERLPREFDALRGELLFPKKGPGGSEQTHEWRIPASGETTSGSRGELRVEGDFEHFEMTADIILSESGGSGGFFFRSGVDHGGGYEVVVDLAAQLLALRPHGQPDRLAVQQIRARPDVPMTLRVFVDGSIVEAFLDDKYSLAGRAYRVAGHKVGFFSHRTVLSVPTCRIFSLKEI